MLKPSHFEALFKQVTSALPKGIVSLHQDVEKNIRVTLESALRRMNLVTREEFEVQSAVLTRTRAKLEELEAQVVALEAMRSAATTDSTVEIEPKK